MPKVREAIKLIEADGWQKVTTKGSHRQFKHQMKTGRVTIAGRLSDDLAPGTYPRSPPDAEDGEGPAGLRRNRPLNRTPLSGE